MKDNECAALQTDNKVTTDGSSIEMNTSAGESGQLGRLDTNATFGDKTDDGRAGQLGGR